MKLNIEELNFRVRLKKMHFLLKEDDSIPFNNWVLKQYYFDHNKSIKMAGDLGQALAKIGELQEQVNELKK